MSPGYTFAAKKMRRRNFIRTISGSILLLADGGILKASPAFEKKVAFRFAVASDGHYGETKTPFDDNYETLVSSINNFHSTSPLKGCVINGDIIHNEAVLLSEAAKHLSNIQPPFFVTRGNHDMVNAETWLKTWKMPLNHEVVIKDQVFLLGDTSNEKGEYLAPDTAFFSSRLEKYKNAKNIFIFLHITPVVWTDNGVDARDFQQLIQRYKNVRAVFNGHDHDQDNVKMLGKIPFLFDGHFGGSWGTAYHGFRVVELLNDNSIHSYIMNATVKMNEFDAMA